MDKITLRFFADEVVPSDGETTAILLPKVGPSDPAGGHHLSGLATSDGSLAFTIARGEAAGFFVRGKEYEVTFTPVGASASSDAEPE